MTILIKKSEERIMYENFDTNERLEEVIQWITNDFWHELSHESKSRVIRQLSYMGYPTEDLEEVTNES
jgi:SOS response regulatory protein OraA/RecX